MVIQLEQGNALDGVCKVFERGAQDAESNVASSATVLPFLETTSAQSNFIKIWLQAVFETGLPPYNGDRYKNMPSLCVEGKIQKEIHEIYQLLVFFIRLFMKEVCRKLNRLSKP